METIESLGGPFLITDSKTAHHWGGIETCSFFAGKTGSSDYEQLEIFLRQKDNIITLHGHVHKTALLITLPLRTAVVTSTDTETILAQVIFAENGWDFENLRNESLDQLHFSKPVLFRSAYPEYILFDAVRSWDDVEGECLKFFLPIGEIECQDAEMMIGSETYLVVYRLRKV